MSKIFNNEIEWFNRLRRYFFPHRHRDWYTISYPMGACGKFFMYFISKHENFLHYDMEYTSINYMAEYYSSIDQVNNNRDPIDIAFTDDDSVNWYYERISFLEYIKQFNNVQKNKIIFRPAPHGKCKEKINSIGIDIFQLQKHIMFDCDNWDWVYNRNEKHMLQFTTIDSDEYIHFTEERRGGGLGFISHNLKLCNFFKQHNCKYVYINPYKLLKLDENEYNTLLTFIKEKPLTNWKEIITRYVNTINLEL
jgi:hypothetical protein